MTKEEKEKEKQVREIVLEYNSALTNCIIEVTNKHIERYGKADKIALSISLSCMFATSLASATEDLTEGMKKKIYKSFFKSIEKVGCNLKNER